ncbi:Flp pilus assembly protein TadD [Variovorax paradoxus]|uniref:Flp pilus assembly protein TadD n=1 Tax=Variovorax paradoxus TaxID=34073 RepID=A0AAE4BYG9_VARPD|nr:tetratricopeptide repeat protein [Variovorax paradoxus]MDR6427024.1 Flp pilus assembly protein TadD [Variovorax paradoxus]
MKPLDFCVSSHPARRMLAFVSAAAAALTVTGCAGIKDQYAASADAQQRMAAEAAADTKAGASVDTQATYLKLVEQMQKENLWFASLAHIDALEQRWGVSPESTRTRAEALRQTGQAAPAEAAYKRLLGTPLASAGYRGLGLLAGTRGNYAEAVQLLTQAQRRTPTDALLLSDLGYAHLRAGQIEEARLPLMQALQLRPDSTQAQANLALYLEVTNQRDQATALMDAHRMSETTRLAVREAALQMRTPGGLAAPVAAAASLSTRGEPIVAPLALKPSRWSGVGGMRTAIQTNPSASTTESPLSPNSTLRGTP